MFRTLCHKVWKNKLHQELFSCFLYFGGVQCGLIWSDLYLKASAFLEMEEFYCTIHLFLLTTVQSSNFYTIWLLNSCLLIFLNRAGQQSILLLLFMTFLPSLDFFLFFFSGFSLLYREYTYMGAGLRLWMPRLRSC